MTRASSGGQIERSIGWLSVFATVVSQGALVAGGGFAAWQFLESRNDARVERTMEYILRYEDGPVGESRRSIRTALRPFASQFAEMGSTVAPESRDQMISTLMEEAGDGRLPDHVDTIVEFYEGLWTCIREQICSRDVSFGYFASDAREFVQNFDPYIRERKLNNPLYGRGLEKIASARPQRQDR